MTGQPNAELAYRPRPRACCTSTEDVGHDFTCPTMLVAAGVAPDVDEQTWRECAHRADYASPAEHARECAYHRGEVDESGHPIVTARAALPAADGPYGVADWRQPLTDFERQAGVIEPVALDYDDVPPNAGSAS